MILYKNVNLKYWMEMQEAAGGNRGRLQTNEYQLILQGRRKIMF